MILLDAPYEVWLRVSGVQGKGLQNKLAGHGLFIGDRLRVLRVAPLNGPLLIEVNRRQIALGQDVVRKISVEIE